MSIPLLPALPGIIYPVQKTPTWNTDVQTSVSGKRSSLARWSYPVYAFELGYEFLRSDTAWGEYQDLVAFYNVANGRANVFRFHDAMDGSVANQPFGIGDGATTAFQLVRAIGGPNYSWSDPVFYQTAAQIFIAGVLKATPADYSISNTGVVTFVVAPALGALLTWTGSFDWICRFDEDSETFEQFTYNLFELKSLKFSSEKI